MFSATKEIILPDIMLRPQECITCPSQNHTAHTKQHRNGAHLQDSRQRVDTTGWKMITDKSKSKVVPVL